MTVRWDSPSPRRVLTPRRGMATGIRRLVAAHRLTSQGRPVELSDLAAGLDALRGLHQIAAGGMAPSVGAVRVQPPAALTLGPGRSARRFAPLLSSGAAPRNLERR